MKYRAIVWSCPRPLLRQLLQLGSPTAGASTSWSRWNPSTSQSLLRPRTRKKPSATSPVCMSVWSCAVTPTAVTRTSSTSCGVSARLGTRSFVIMYQHVACKNMATVQGILDEQGRERGLRPDLGRARSYGPAYRFPPHHARQGQRVHAYRHEGRACRPVPRRVRGRGMYVSRRSKSFRNESPLARGFLS